MPRALVFGGGGVTHGADPQLEVALMARLPDAPRIGHIGLANGDDADRRARVQHRFATLGASVLHLPMHADAAAAEIWTSHVDAIYVGGGNTALMLASWRASGIDRVLAAAARRGVVVSGVSAGAVCWFDWALWDGAGAGFRPLRGLGVLPGSCCPHYTSEPRRAAAYHDHVARGDLPAGYGLGDGAGLWLDGNAAPLAVAARPDTGVWWLAREGDAVRARRVPALDRAEHAR